MKTFNKRGDCGETSLLYGGRVPKSHARTEAYGAIDEAVSALGLARSLCHDPKICSTILHCQQELFYVGAELATDAGHYDKLARNFTVIAQPQVDRLEEMIVSFESEITMPGSFIIPGNTPAGAALDVARTVVRRCERRAVGLQSEGLLNNDAILAYLNRLADLIFTLARYEEEQSSPMTVDTASGTA